MRRFRHVFVTKHSPGTHQLAQLLKVIILTTQGNSVVFAGVDKDGEPTEVNDYCTMRLEQFPCEGKCWKDFGEPPITEHICIVSPGLVARVCCSPGCGAFFIVDTIDAPYVATLPYEVQKEASVNQAYWYNRVLQGKELRKEMVRKREYSKKYMRNKRERQQTEAEGGESPVCDDGTDMEL